MSLANDAGIHISKLTHFAKANALDAVQDQAVTLAKAAADALDGRIVQNDYEAAEVSDLILQAKSGLTTLRKSQKALREPYDAAVAQINGVLGPVMVELQRGAQGGQDALNLWGIWKQRRAVAEAEEKRKAAEAQAAADAALLGDDAAPAVEVVVEKPPPQTRGGSSISYETRVLKCELVNPNECDPTWLDLNQVAAKAAFRFAIQRGEVQETAAGVVFQGVRFWRETSVTTKAAMRTA